MPNSCPQHLALSVLTSLPRMLAVSSISVQPNKAIVGANAFAHESGIHQDGMLKSKDTYEIMSPETIGLVRQDDAGIVLGKHSGRHAVRTRLEEMGYPLEGPALDAIFARFKDLADKILLRCSAAAALLRVQPAGTGAPNSRRVAIEELLAERVGYT